VQKIIEISSSLLEVIQDYISDIFSGIL